MAGEKRNADASADSTAPKKKSKPIDNFPKFHDGDVTIIIGDLELKLHSKLLIAKCNYFAERAEYKRFTIRPYDPNEHDENTDCPPLTVAPDSVYQIFLGMASKIDDGYIKRSRAANEAFFRLLYNRPLSSLTPAEFRDVAILTSDYDCVQRVKDALIIAFFKANLGSTPFVDNPWAILYAADQLKDEALYHEAMVHIIGRGGLRSKNNEFVQPWSAVEIIKQTNELEEKVRDCWAAAMGCCKDDDVASVVAAAAMRSYIGSYVPRAMADPLQQDVYDVLRSLHNMEDAEKLSDADLLTELDHLDDGLIAGGLALDRLKGSSLIDEDTYNSLDVRVSTGLGRRANSEKVLGELERLLASIKTALNPLFVGDRNVGYFTCVQIKSPNPW
ncbi:hypothetical protein UCDDS831_g00908 [Diplodia seriata]|uniref:BTB domain-containing protein n=1 Tax=Diplodia seriata TaxID=420778 RepID=A0A0G2GV81_9PEZI|nr:hypothetical protein UCDDS831_g00908 [Diplodia seriata]